jgi:hypothetical protein
MNMLLNLRTLCHGDSGFLVTEVETNAQMYVFLFKDNNY